MLYCPSIPWVWLCWGNFPLFEALEAVRLRQDERHSPSGTVLYCTTCTSTPLSYHGASGHYRQVLPCCSSLPPFLSYFDLSTLYKRPSPQNPPPPSQRIITTTSAQHCHTRLVFSITLSPSIPIALFHLQPLPRRYYLLVHISN